MILSLARSIMLYSSRTRHTLFERNLLNLYVADVASSICFVGVGSLGVYEMRQAIVVGNFIC